MKIKIFSFNMFSVNTYIVWDETSLETAIIDPGMISDADNQKVSEFIQLHRLKVMYLINTHLHIDHTLGNDYIEQTYGIGTSAHPSDEFLGAQRASQSRMFGLGLTPQPLKISGELTAGEKIPLGKEYLEVIEVPGHSPGSVAFYSPAGSFVITGDALFNSGIGRTDLPGGNHSQLLKSITQQLFTLPPDTIVYPGHGPVTTIGNERMSNPYITNGSKESRAL